MCDGISQVLCLCTEERLCLYGRLTGVGITVELCVFRCVLIFSHRFKVLDTVGRAKGSGLSMVWLCFHHLKEGVSRGEGPRV